MDRRHSSRQAYRLIALLALAFGLLADSTAARANAISTAPLCGDGAAPDYGFTYDLLQPHWTVGWEPHASEQTVSEVDTVLDRLNEDLIAQTMILIKSQDEVGIRTNCAVHFLRYMQLGLPSGQRKDNGFVFLIVVEPDSIDVHYAVGLGLPALTARELTNLNRDAEAAYQSSHSMDQALLTLVREFDVVTRTNYAPLIYPTSTAQATDLPAGPVGTLAICGQLCLGIILLLFLFWIFSQMGSGGGTGFYPTDSTDSGSWGRGGFSSGRGGFSSGRGGFSSGGGGGGY